MGKYFLNLLTFALAPAGAFLKGRDSNNTGADDVFGNIFIAAGPAVEDLVSGQETTKTTKAITAIRDACDSYLATRK